VDHDKVTTVDQDHQITHHLTMVAVVVEPEVQVVFFQQVWV
jgi:hypothetical protein